MSDPGISSTLSMEVEEASGGDGSGAGASKQIKFISPEDKVVSEVNPFLVTAKSRRCGEAFPLQQSSNQIAVIKFEIPKSLLPCRPTEGTSSTGTQLEADEDGDLVLPRQTGATRDFELLIEYENSTTLSLVGLQIWRGAFLLSDFAIHFANEYFEGKNIVELGAGTGMVGIVSALFSASVVLTDLNEASILDLIKANIGHNENLIQTPKCTVLPLDFMNLNWSPQLADTIGSADTILAADVIYHVEITNAFIKTLKSILSCGVKAKDIFIALEKRYVFTIYDQDSVAPMHNHFLEEIDKELDISPGCMPRPWKKTVNSSGQLEISMSSVPLTFPQYFNYDRCKELVLYHIKLRNKE